MGCAYTLKVAVFIKSQYFWAESIVAGSYFTLNVSVKECYSPPELMVADIE